MNLWSIYWVLILDDARITASLISTYLHGMCELVLWVLTYYIDAQYTVKRFYRPQHDGFCVNLNMT